MRYRILRWCTPSVPSLLFFGTPTTICLEHCKDRKMSRKILTGNLLKKFLYFQITFCSLANITRKTPQNNVILFREVLTYCSSQSELIELRVLRKPNCWVVLLRPERRNFDGDVRDNSESVILRLCCPSSRSPALYGFVNRYRN